MKPTTMVLLVFEFITKDVFNKVITQMKNWCEGPFQHLVVKLEQHFFEHEVMTTLNVVYPQL
jgi:hypothetical protein